MRKLLLWRWWLKPRIELVSAEEVTKVRHEEGKMIEDPVKKTDLVGSEI